MAGYSGTPLAKKLGIKEDFIVRFYNELDDFRTLLNDLPKSVTITSSKRSDLDLVIFFSSSAAKLQMEFASLMKSIKKDGTLWISWPKKTSKLAGDLNENFVRQIGLEAGLVDVKVCAIDEDWSGLKFVYRVIDR
ncbi:MAG TPA: DUF3052 family protein [Candidatus Kapabacteria bacterium]|nr:DUF3052 family protein [Candidatus Kapabacteria bacterium]